MRIAAVVLLLGTSVLSAQTSSSGAPVAAQHTTAVMEQPLPGACPVGFSATRGTLGGGLRAVSPGAEQDAGFASVNLLFAPEAETRVVGARVTLYGLAGEQVVPAGSAAGRRVRESFTLVLSPDGEQRFVSVVRARRLTGVETVELNELTYADGRVWRPSMEKRCRIVPDGLVLVGLK